MIKIDGTRIKADFFLVPKCLKDNNILLGMDTMDDLAIPTIRVGTNATSNLKIKVKGKWLGSRRMLWRH